MSSDRCVGSRARINTGLQPGACATRRALAVLTAFGDIVLGSAEWQRHARFVAEDPAVVRGRRDPESHQLREPNYAAIIGRSRRLPRAVGARSVYGRQA